MQLEIDRLEEKVKQQTELLRNGTRRKGELDAAIAAKQKELEANQAELGAKRAELIENQTALEANRAELEAADAKVTKAKADLADLLAQLENTKKTSTPAQANSASLDAAIQRTREIQSELVIPDPNVRAALANIEAKDTAVRTKAVNALAFQYGSSREAKSAILAMLSEPSISNLSEQGIINCVIILARHKPSSWTKALLDQAAEVMRGLERRSLTERQRGVLNELKAALPAAGECGGSKGADFLGG